MKVQAIRRGYGYLFNAGLFSQFHATVNTLSTRFTDGKWTRGSLSRLVLASCAQTWRFQQKTKKPKYSTTSGEKKGYRAFKNFTLCENKRINFIETYKLH